MKSFIFNTRISLLILVLSLTINTTFSQTTTSIDGLVKLLDKSDDSSKVIALKLLCWEYRNIDTAYALNYGNEALKLAKKLNLSYELADIHNRLGIVKRNQGKYADALDNYFKGLEISQKNNYLKLLALEFNNISDIYNRLGIYDKALEYGKKGLSISSQLDDNYTLSYVYNILGTVYKNQQKLDSALFYFNKSLNIRKQINFISGIATSYLNIGNVYYLTGKYDSSYLFLTKSIEIYDDKNDQTGLAGSYKQIGIYYNHQKEYKKAIQNFNKCIELNKRFGDLQVEKEAAEGLKYSYQKLGDINKAFYYQELASTLSDSITINIFVERITHLTENFKFELQRQEEELLSKEREASLSNKLTYRRSLIVLFAIILILTISLVVTSSKLKRYKRNTEATLNKNKFIS